MRGVNATVRGTSLQIHPVLHISLRDRDLLTLLDRTPVTAALALKASSAFTGESFKDERRVRERLQQLCDAGLSRRFMLAQAGGGAMNYYKLTAAGFAALYGSETALPPRACFSEVPLSRLEHTLELAEVIVHTLVAAQRQRVTVTKFHRENELTLQAGSHIQQPDFHIQLHQAGKTFNVLVELDRGTESVDSPAGQSIRQKILGYEAYQDLVWLDWKQAGERGQRPYFKVAFLTSSTARAYHILALAKTLARNGDRQLCYAVSLDEYLACPDAVRAPLFLDHGGHWQSLVNLHPTSSDLRAPVRLPASVDAGPTLW
jgi:hypothetical protein